MSDQPSSEHPGVEPRASDSTGPKRPPENYNYYPAIICFNSGGHEVAIGDLEKGKHHERYVQAALTSRHTATHSPFIRFQVRLRRSEDTMHLYSGQDKRFHRVVFRVFLDDYSIEHHRANSNDQEWFIRHAAMNSALAEKAYIDDKLYVVNFFFGGERGPRVHGLGSSFMGANAAVDDTYNHLSSVTSNSMVKIYLWEYEYVSAELQWSVADQETGGWFS